MTNPVNIRLDLLEKQMAHTLKLFQVQDKINKALSKQMEKNA